MKEKSKSEVSIIGGADGPTSIFIAGRTRKKPLKVRIQNIIYRYRRKIVEKKVVADAHTLDELVQYAMNTYNLIETNSTERKYIEQQKSLKESLILQHKPEVLVVIAGPLVLYKDNNPIPSRFTLMALICATIGVFCLMVTSSWCKERVSITVEKREKFNYFEALKHIIKNRALLGLIFSSLAGMIAASVVNGLNTYLFKDYFGNVQIMAVSGMLSTVYSIITFVGTKFVSKKFGKKEWCMYGAGFAAIVFGILFFFPIKNPTLFIVINGICYLGASGFQVLIWAMVNDAIDYQELTTGDRKEGMVYATYSFFRKLASAVSSSLSSFTLALIGYNVNEAVQTAAVKAHIWKSYTAIYAIGYLIAVLILYFVYPLSKKKTEEMLETLAKKRAKQGE